MDKEGICRKKSSGVAFIFGISTKKGACQTMRTLFLGVFLGVKNVYIRKEKHQKTSHRA